MKHPGEALLEEEQRRNAIIRQHWLAERARALVLERELRAMRAQRAARRPLDMPP